MDRILSLALSYPDFQLNQIIDPDQVDLNNKQLTDKINQLITAINTFTQGTAGATHIAITPLPEFPTATNVQTALQQIATYAKSNKTVIDQILSKNTEQDGRLTTLETRLTTNDAKDTAQDTTIANLTKTVNDNFTSLSSRITTNETVDSQQTSRLVIAESKLDRLETSEIPSIKADITKHTSDINSVKAKNTEQDARISSIETREEIDGTWISAIEGKVDINKTDIVQIKKDLSEISAINPSAELVEARTSGNTGVVYDKLSLRLDDNEIAVGVAIPNDKRTNINFHVTGEEGTGTWEDTVKLGSLDEHNASTDVHHGLIGSHELNMNSHADIRADVSNNNTTLTNKINLVEAKVGADMGVISAELNERVDGLDDKFRILSDLQNGFKFYKSLSELGLTSSNTTEQVFRTMQNNSYFTYDGVLADTPSSTRGISQFTKLADARCNGVFTSIEASNKGVNYSCAFSTSTTPNFSGWKQLATSDEISILSANRKLLTYTDISQLGLVDADFASKDLSGCLTLIASKMQNFARLEMRITTGYPNMRANIAMGATSTFDVTLYDAYVCKANLNWNGVKPYTCQMNGANTAASWQQLATTDKIDISFPYASGYTDDASGDSSSKITKINNTVEIICNLKKTDTSPLVASSTEPIFTLPVGYRPQKTIRLIASCLPYGQSATMLITTSGNAYIRALSNTNVTHLMCIIRFEVI